MQKGDNCQEFKNLVFNTFAAILDGHNAIIVELVKVTSNRCLLVVELDNCRIRFKLNQGAFSVFIGNISATPTWENGQSKSTEWYSYLSALDYVQGRAKPSLEEIDKRVDRSRGLSVQEQAQKAASTLGKNFTEVCNLFAASEKSAEFKAFLKYYFDTSNLDP